MTDISYVRHEFVAPEKAPLSESTVIGWARKNLFASVTDSIMSLVAIAVLIYFLPGLLNWLFVKAVWTGTDRTACLTTVQGGALPEGWNGACWAYVGNRFGQFMFGSYPRDQLWRPLLVVIMFVGLLIPFLMPKMPRKVCSSSTTTNRSRMRKVAQRLWEGRMPTCSISGLVSTTFAFLRAHARSSDAVSPS